MIEFPTIEIRPAEDYRAAGCGAREPGRLRLADLHQRQRRAVLQERLELRDRDLEPFRGACLRHRSGHAQGGGEDSG